MIGTLIIIGIVSLVVSLMVWSFKAENKAIKISDQNFKTAKKNVRGWIHKDNYTYLEAANRIWKEFKGIGRWTIEMNRMYFRLLGYANGRVNHKNENKTELSDFRNGYYI